MDIEELTLENNIIFGLIFGIIAYVILYLGKGIQKYAIEGFKNDKTQKGKNKKIWIFGFTLTTSYLFIHWIALLYAPLNIIVPLGGIGLIVLIVFSYFVLHEHISKIQITGIALIIMGIILATIFNVNTGELKASDFNFTLYLIISLILIAVNILAIIIIRYKDYIAAGLILGIAAGTFNALQTVSKRITAIPDPTIRLIFILNTFLMAVITLLMQQFAYTKSKANVTIPCYTSASIILALFLGVVTLNETLILIQIIGVCFIIVGVFCISAFIDENISINNEVKINE